MALLSRNEFADHIGKNVATVNVYIARGKLIPSGKLIDTNLDENRNQMIKWGVNPDIPVNPSIIRDTPLLENDEVIVIRKKKPETRGRKKKIDTPVKPKITQVPKSKATMVPKNRVSKTDKKKTEPENVPDYSRYVPDKPTEPDYSRVKGNSDLDTQKKEAEIIKIKETTLNTQLRNAKLRGESIPTEMVSSVISSLGIGFLTEYKNGVDGFILELGHKFKIPPEAISDLKIKMVKLINKSHERSIDIAKKNLRKIINQTKSVEVNSSLVDE